MKSNLKANLENFNIVQYEESTLRSMLFIIFVLIMTKEDQIQSDSRLIQNSSNSTNK